MKVKSVTASASAKINTGNYESRDVFASFGLELDDGDSWKEAQANAFAMARASVAAQEKFIRDGASPEPPQSLIDAVIVAQLKLANGENIMPIRVIEQQERRAMYTVIARAHKGSAMGTFADGSAKETYADGTPKGWRGGEEHKHWRLNFDDDQAVYQERFTELYGDKPMEFRAMLTSPEVDDVFQYWYETWDAGENCTHRCDGEEIVYPSVQKGQPCQWRAGGKKPKTGKGYKGCSEKMRLFVCPYEICGPGEVIMVKSSAFQDCTYIRDQLDFIKKSAGSLTGVPLLIKRKLRNISMGEGNARQDRWMISVEIDGERWIAQQAGADQPAPDAPPPGVDPDTGEIMGDDASDEATFWWGSAMPTRPKTGERPWPGKTAREVLRYTALQKDVKADDWVFVSPDRAADDKRLADGLTKHLNEGSRPVLLRYLFPEVDALTDSMAATVADWLASEKTNMLEVLNCVAQWWLTEHRALCEADEPGKPLLAAQGFADNGRAIDSIPELPAPDAEQDEIPF